MEHDGFRTLLARARTGDGPAVDAILSRARPHLERLLRRFVDRNHPEESLSDLVQETWLRAWQRIEQFEGGTDDEGAWRAFLSWIGHLAYRLGLNAVRDRNALCRGAGETRGGLEQAGDRADAAANPDAITSAEERQRLVQAALDALPDGDQREIVRLHVFEGVPFREVGARLSLTYDQVRDRYHAAMRRLQPDLRRLL